MRCARCNDTRPTNQAGHCEPCARKLAGLCAYTQCTNKRPPKGALCCYHYRQRRRGEALRPVEPRPTPAETAAEVEWLIGTDTTDNIARRLGKTRAALYLALRRAGRHDLVDQLAEAQRHEATLLRESTLGHIQGPNARKAA